MSKVMYEKLLASLKKANKQRRQKMSEKAGFKNYKDYKKALEFLISGGKSATSETISNPKEQKVIHILDVLDKSGSMGAPGTQIFTYDEQGRMFSKSKLKASVEGITTGIKDICNPVVKGVKYTYSLVAFSSREMENCFFFMETPDETMNFSTYPSGLTALYDGVHNSVQRIMESPNYKKGDNVLVNVYTDGGENDSRITTRQFKTFLKGLPETVTITFVAVKHDAEGLIKDLEIDPSNIRIYDGSSKDMEAAYDHTRSARSQYSKSVVRGKSVTTGFYYKTVKE